MEQNKNWKDLNTVREVVLGFKKITLGETYVLIALDV